MWSLVGGLFRELQERWGWMYKYAYCLTTALSCVQGGRLLMTVEMVVLIHGPQHSSSLLMTPMSTPHCYRVAIKHTVNLVYTIQCTTLWYS